MRSASFALTTLFGFALSLCLTACADPLPHYPRMSAEQSLATIVTRLDSVRTLSSACEVSLTDANAQSVHLDGALAVELPGRLRLRAWKFGQAVFDLTALDDGVWLMTTENSAPDPTPNPPAISTDNLRRALALIGPDFYRSATPVAPNNDTDPLIVSGPGFANQPLLCEIDRATLTPRRFTLAATPPTRDHAHPASIILDNYQLLSGIPFPTRIRVAGPDGQISLHLQNPELNAALPDNAFRPPSRAVKQP